MNARPDLRESRAPVHPVRERGQAMVEYTVILVFGGLVLLGPGGDAIRTLVDVIKNNYRAYSYSMSLSTLPDFETGLELGGWIVNAENRLPVKVDGVTLARLTEDPYTTATGRLNATLAQLNRAIPQAVHQITSGGVFTDALKLYSGDQNAPLPTMPPTIPASIPPLPPPPGGWPPTF